MRPLILLLALTACRTKSEVLTDTGSPGTTADTSIPTDEDGDGYAQGEDCDDGDASVNPGAAEACDGIDNNCDGEVDEGVTQTWYADTDSDGFGDPASSTQACAQPSGFVSDATDCDDASTDVNPDATEACNAIDDDCDGAIDEDDAADASTWYADTDGDGFGDAASSTQACAQPSGYAADDTDCDDASADVNPDASELCNAIDDDCDGTIDEDDADDASTWYADADLDGYGDAASSTQACNEPSGYTADDTDCDDTNADINPGATEVCDGADDDCDGDTDEGFDDDSDGIANCFEIEYDVDIVYSVDDNWEGYVDEDYYGPYGGWSTSDTISVTMDSGDHTVAIYGWDSGKVIAGFIGEVQINGVTEYLTGDGSWVMVDDTTDADWYAIDYDDSAWGAPVLCDSSTVSTYWGSSPSDLTGVGAQWIWHTTCTDLGDSYYRLDFNLP